MAAAICVMNSFGVPGRSATSTSIPVLPVKSSVERTSFIESTAQLPTPMVIFVCALTWGARTAMVPAKAPPAAASNVRRVSADSISLPPRRRPFGIELNCVWWDIASFRAASLLHLLQSCVSELDPPGDR